MARATCYSDPSRDTLPEGNAIGIRTYARIAGLVLLALAIGGFLVWDWKVAASFFYTGVGLLFLYVGFMHSDEAVVRQMVEGLGMLLLLVKLITIVVPLMWGARPLHGPIEISCLVLGVSSILAARFLRS